MKVGTFDNPIRLVQENTRRIGLDANSNIWVNEIGVYDFGRLKKPKNKFDLIINNIAFNPYLTAQEIRVALKIYDLLFDGFFNNIFLTVTSREFHMRTIGESDEIIFSSSKLSPFHWVIKDKQSLLDILKTVHVCLSPFELIEILNKLHDYYYITCTELASNNAAEYRRGFDYKNNVVHLSDTCKIAHIRINGAMDKVDLTNNWMRR